MKPLDIFASERRGGVLPDERATYSMGFTLKNRYGGTGRGKSGRYKTPLFYLRSVRENTYFCYCRYYRRFSLVSCTETFWVAQGLVVQAQKLYRGGY